MLWDESIFDETSETYDEFFALKCGECGDDLMFLCQISAPLESEFRTVYLWFCLRPKCASLNRGWRALVQVGPESAKDAQALMDARRGIHSDQHSDEVSAAVADSDSGTHSDNDDDIDECKYPSDDDDHHHSHTLSTISESHPLPDQCKSPASIPHPSVTAQSSSESAAAVSEKSEGFGSLRLKGWNSWKSDGQRSDQSAVESLLEETKETDVKLDALSAELFALLDAAESKAKSETATAIAKEVKAQSQRKKRQRRKKRRKQWKVSGSVVELSPSITVDFDAEDTLRRMVDGELTRLFAPFYLQWYHECFYDGWTPLSADAGLAEMRKISQSAAVKHGSSAEKVSSSGVVVGAADNDDSDEDELDGKMGAMVEFMERVSLDTRQVVRYAYKDQPLFPIAHDTLIESLVPQCECCSLDRFFELQITSTVLTQLRPQFPELEHHSWLTVAVYVCPDSCQASSLEVPFVVSEPE